MARARIFTIAPLDTYQAIMGIDPIQFNGGNNVGILTPANQGCKEIWYQNEWQSRTRVSREELAREMRRAERDVANELRYWPAPAYIEDEEIYYHQFFDPEKVGLTGKSANGHYKPVILNKERFIAGGKRTLELVEAGAALTYTDPTFAAYNLTATLSVLTDIEELTELRVFFPGKDGAPEWEIRPLKEKAADGTNFTATLDTHLLFDPDVQDAWPGTTFTEGLNINTAANFLTEVDVYRVYTDPEAQCTLKWSSLNHNVITENQTAYFKAKKPLYGVVSPIPATYADGAFADGAFINGFEPDRITAAYLSGYVEIQEGQYVLPHDLAMAVVYLATARIEKPICGDCEYVKFKEAQLKEDLILMQARGEVKFIRRDIIECPFGSHYGEVEAWRIVKRFREEQQPLQFALL